MISLNKRTGCCNVLSPNICIPKERKDTNVKGFNMIINKCEAKARTRHISCDCKYKFNSTTCNLNQKGKKKTCQCECKNYHKCDKDCSWNRTTCICENSKYLKSISDTSVTDFDEIVVVWNKNVWYEMENNEFKKARIKIRTCYYFDDTIKLEDFNLDNTLTD